MVRSTLQSGVVLYSDRLVVLTRDSIVFENYFFPVLGGRKVVKLADIEQVTVERPTLWNGKWRLHGTGNFRTWFPRDYSRPKRDRIFFAALKSRRMKIGFTVEDGERVEAIFRDMRLIKDGRDQGRE